MGSQWESKSSSSSWQMPESSASRQEERWPPAVVSSIPDQRSALRAPAHAPLVSQPILPAPHAGNVFLGAAAQAANIMMGAMGTTRPAETRYDAYKTLPGAGVRRY